MTDPYYVTDEGIQALKVESYSLPDSEEECILYSIYMVLKYFSNHFPVKRVRDQLDVPQLSEIEEHVNVSDSGWTATDEELNSLSDITYPVAFKNKYWESPPSVDKLWGTLESKLDNDMPTIAVVDGYKLKHIEGGNGPKHSVVVIGIGDTNVVINNPWGTNSDKQVSRGGKTGNPWSGPIHQTFKKKDFEEAWHVGMNRLITTETAQQTQLGELS